MPEQQTQQQVPTGGVEVRVLVDHQIDQDTLLKCNSVATLDAKTASALKKAGIVDDDADAVAYAKQVAAQRKRDEDRAKNGGAIA